MTSQYCVGFAIHWHESAMGVHVFPILKPFPTSLPSTGALLPSSRLFLKIFLIYIYFNLEANYFTILCWFCHTSTWIHHGCTRVPHPERLSHLPPHNIPLGHPSAPALSILYHASNLDWQFVSHMILYMFQCHSPKSSHPRPLLQSPKDCSIHLCLFCCLAYRVIITIFLNSTYMCYPSVVDKIMALQDAHALL